MKIEWLSDPLDLELVEGAWRDLETGVERRTHVSTFDFLATWYRHYAGAYGGTPLIGLAWNGTELLGIAPLTIRRGRVGRIPVTRIDFAPNDSIAGEFLVRDNRADVVRALLDSLTTRARFDVICLNGFEPDSPELRAIQEAADQRLSIGLEDHAFALVDVSRGYEQVPGRASTATCDARSATGRARSRPTDRPSTAPSRWRRPRASTPVFAG